MIPTWTDPFDLDIRFLAADDADGGDKPAISGEAVAGCIGDPRDDAAGGSRGVDADCVGNPPGADAPADTGSGLGECIGDPPREGRR
jgi:hypothetical protein